MDRIKKLCGFLDPCQRFADVGCDHGYCTLYMLKNSLCNTAVISDVSDKCLGKARKLLSDYIDGGIVTAVCCNGLEKITDCDEVLIAGMGGEEITAILKRGYIPDKFILQPMRNARTLREFLLESGAVIVRDSVFEHGGKFYTVIKGASCGEKAAYSEAELEYGKEIGTAEVKRYLQYELNKKKEYLARVPDGRDKRLEKEIELISGALQDGI